jgi:hypothetical protein
MKKFFAMMFAALFVLLSGFAQAAWYTSNIITNPTVNQIIADTGAIGDGYGHDFDVCVSSTVAAAIVVEWRDASNTTNVFAHIIPIPANGFACFTSRGSLTFQANERVRLRMNAAVTGSVQGSINFF